MGFLGSLFYPWGLLLEAAAIIHFIRRRPDTYWIFIIIFLGPLGALIYLFAEALPDLGILRQSFKTFPRRKRIAQLLLEIHDNPSAGNYEELGDLYMDEGKLQPAREAFDKAIAARSDTLDCFYRRGICALLLGDAAAALPDLEMAVREDAGHDFYRAAGLLAHAYAQTGQAEKADAMFRQAVERSTLSETYLNYADFLASAGRNAEARQWAQKVLDKKPTMPGYLRRRERPWFRRASATLKRVPA
ncbi:TPR repeat protein [Candidatus Sulfotelmatomonas gaucii]|uniref:TPR repeat protein n=1 Tax=Candidatus Sulfuritelmatomonas gaucii TaxID=2043161 RepID=A0A2N9LD43_9BACT|nr:TPR repeat protein [Candidatus Sulfotelmatomonas gaucii]